MIRFLRRALVFLCALASAPALAQSPDFGGTSTGGGVAARRESFKSDLFTGAMTESIPIVVPAGANGFQPTVELTYDSNRGTTALGRGWDIRVNAIRRDMRVSDERFLLDDDPLVRADNGLYRPMIDDFTRIERINSGGETYFVAHGPDGTTSWYGYSDGKRLTANGETTTWLLERIVDRNGNYIRFVHHVPTGPPQPGDDEDVGTAYLEAIFYSFRGDGGEALGSSWPSSPTVRWINFSYQDRPDPSFAYLGGVRTEMTRRLSQINVSLGGSIVSRYDLIYVDEETSETQPANRRSLLHRVRYYGANGAPELPSPRYRYSGRTGPAYTGTGPFSTAFSAAFSSVGADLSAPLIDVNSDGAVDLIWAGIQLNKKGLPGEVGLHPSIATVSPVFDVPTLDRDGPSCRPPEPFWSCVTPSSYFPRAEQLGHHWVGPLDPDAHWADYDGDGRVDILYGRYQYTSISTQPPEVTPTATPTQIHDDLCDDCVTEYKGACRNTGTDWSCSSTGYGAIPTYPARILRCGRWSPPNESPVFGTPHVYWEFIPLSYTELADVNGDGLADLLEHRIDPNKQSISCDNYYLNYASNVNQWRQQFTVRRVFLNTGTGWVQTHDSQWSSRLDSLLNATSAFLSQLQFFDLNGDGLIDVGADTDGDGAVEKTSVRIGRGNAGWISAGGAGFNAESIPDELRLADIDGDGLPDHVAASTETPPTPLFNTGQSFSAPPPGAPIPSWLSSFQPSTDRVVDIDGDGVADRIRSFNGVNTVLASADGTSAGEPVAPQGLLEEESFPTGGKRSVTYRASSQGTCTDTTSGGCNATFHVWSDISACSAPRMRVSATPAGYTPDPSGSLCGFPVEQLPMTVQTVGALKVHDGEGGIRADVIGHDLGFFSAKDREFRGFGRVTELPHSESFVNPKTGQAEVVRPARVMLFYQHDFLRGRPAAVVDSRLDAAGLVHLLRMQIGKYFVTRGDLNTTYILQGTQYNANCDIKDEGQIPGCADLQNIDSVAPQWTLPSALPFGRFNNSFGSANDDRHRAYLTLDAGSTEFVFDGEPTAVQIEHTQWHDKHGNVQLRMELGDVTDPSDDRAVLTAFADDGCSEDIDLDPIGACSNPRNLRSLPRWSQSGALFASSGQLSFAPLAAIAFDYDGLANGAATKGNLTQERRGFGTSETRIDRTYAPSTYGLPDSVSDPYSTGQTPVVTTRTYDSRQAFVTQQVQQVAGSTFTRRATYDPPGAPKGLGLIHTIEDENGAWTGLGYDAFGRRTCSTRRYSSTEGPPTTANVCALQTIEKVETRIYDDTPGLDLTKARVTASVDDGNGNLVSSRAYWDGLGRTVRTESSGLQTSPGGVESSATIVAASDYSVAGRLSFRSRAGFGAPAPGTSFFYDESERPRFLVAANGGIAETVFSKLSTTFIDAEGRNVSTLSNAHGEIVRVTEHADTGDQVTRYGYDPAGRLRFICDALASSCPTISCGPSGCSVDGGDPRHSTRIDYDSLGRRTALFDPDHGASQRSYDARSNVIQTTDANNRTIAYKYDTLGRLKCENPAGIQSCDGADVTYTYGDELVGTPSNEHSHNRPGVVTTPVGSYKYKYDPTGRVRETTLTLPGGATHYTRAFTFDRLGRVKTSLYPDGELVSRTYDLMGLERIESIDEGYVANVGYNAEGAITRLQYGNGVVRQIDYRQSDGLPERVFDDAGGTAGHLLERTYGYELTGKISSISDLETPSESLTNLEYDELGRLRSGTRGGNQNFSYAYDPIGNLTDKDGTVLPYQHPTKPHAVYDAAALSRWGYDAAGNLTRRNNETLHYDARNRLSEIQGSVASQEFYDHRGERAKRVHGADSSLFFGLDYEIMNGKRFIKTIRVGALTVARRDVVAPQAGSGASLVQSREDWRDFLETAIALQFGAGTSLLAWVLVARRRRGMAILRPAAAGSLCVLLITLPFESALAAAPSGDLNSDGRLDVADALLAERLSEETLPAPTSQQLENADVAPLEVAPDGEIGPNDTLLLIRGATGEDVDDDGLESNDELSAGTSPFRSDTDRDGLTDDVELAQGLDPTRPDTDEDGLSDGDELSAGADPFDPDSDDDGIVDGRDGTPSSFTGAQLHFLHTDHLGGVAMVTDGAKSAVRRIHYGIWGETRANEIPAGAPASSPKPREAFTGQSSDPGTELIYYGARFYDPASGRFLNPDAVLASPFDPQQLNRYAYVGNDPLNFTDPTGNLQAYVPTYPTFAPIPDPIGPSQASFWAGVPGRQALRPSRSGGDGVDTRAARAAQRAANLQKALNGGRDEPAVGTPVSQASEHDALVAASRDAQARIAEFIEKNSGQDVPLPASDLNAIIDAYASAVARTAPESLSELISRSLYGADSNFRWVWANQQFAVTGMGELDGVYRGATINYFFQGLLAASAGGSVTGMNARIVGWNGLQFFGGFGISNVPQAWEGMSWARYGYDRYLQSHGQ